MYADRQNRVRIVQALEETVKQFRTRQELWPLRVPREPVSFDSIAARTIGGAFDPLSLRSRTLLWLEWPDGATWELWVISLPSGLKLYCDTGDGETRLLASGRRDSEIDTDRHLLELLSESAGEHFGIEMDGGPPSRVRSNLTDGALVVDFFVNLFEVLGMEQDVRAAGRCVPSGDFRDDIENWLRQTGFRPPGAGP
jgi:hypothetical protein